MNFSRWGGLGDHRNPVHFSGDTHSNWETLEFLVPFTATAGNVGAAYWSHDMGGHFPPQSGPNPELFTRWMQFGVLSPVLRVHSARDKDNDRRPWLFGEPWTGALRKAYALRRQILPYLYTTARRCHDTGLPLLRPMYLGWPRESQAYAASGQFMLGDDLLVAPTTRPGFGRTKVAHVPVWFPEGDWYHWETHQRFSGPLSAAVAVPLDGCAVFARGGAPIPLQQGAIRLYPGPSALRELYEDDGESTAYTNGEFRRTPLVNRDREGRTEFSLGPCDEDYEGAPENRPAMTLELPWNTSESAAFPSAALDSVASVGVAAGPGRQTSDLKAEALDLLHRVSLSLCELEARDPLTALAEEARLLLLGVQTKIGQGPSPSALDRDLQDARQKAFQLLRALAARRTGSDQAALRILAGVSMQVLAKPSPEPSKIVLEVELLRSSPKTSLGRLEIVADKAGEPLRRDVELGSQIRQVWDLEWPVDFGGIGELEGSVELHCQAFGQDLVLSETFYWNATAVRDWMLLAPIEAGSGPQPGEVLESLRAARGYPGMDGGELHWRPYRMSPSGLPRGFRKEVYDFGDTFLCPVGEAWSMTVLDANAEGVASLELQGGNNGLLWVNGEEAGRGRGTFEVRLRRDANLVVVKVSHQQYEGHGFVLRVAAKSMGLRFRLPQGDRGLQGFRSASAL